MELELNLSGVCPEPEAVLSASLYAVNQEVISLTFYAKCPRKFFFEKVMVSKVLIRFSNDCNNLWNMTLFSCDV